MNEMILVSAFTMGLLGAGHCAGMCGGIAAALSMDARTSMSKSGLGMLPIVSAYNIGRVSSYTIAGALFGWIGSLGWSVVTPDHAILYSRYIGIAFMVALGLYLLGWWQGLAYLEQMGGKLWRYVEPFGRRFLPVRRPHQAALLGLVWGWLPCGMVYTGLSWSLAAGSLVQGAYIMLAFGAGTLPALMAMGVGGNWVNKWIRQPQARQIAGIIVLIMAGYALASGHGPGHVSSASTEASQIHSM